MLVLHAVVGDDDDDGAAGVEFAQILVHHGVEAVGAFRARRIFVLHVVGGGEIHEVRLHAGEQLDARGEDEFRELRRIDVRHAHAGEAAGIRDAVVLHVHLVGLLGGEGDRRAVEDEALAEEQAELVLGRHHGDLGTRLLEGFEDGGGAEPLGIVHHRLLAGGGIDEVVAADAVDGGRAAGDDREVVGVGEARDHRVAPAVLALGDDALEVRHQALLHGDFHVGGLAAVTADDDKGAEGQL